MARQRWDSRHQDWVEDEDESTARCVGWSDEEGLLTPDGTGWGEGLDGMGGTRDEEMSREGFAGARLCSQQQQQQR